MYHRTINHKVVIEQSQMLNKQLPLPKFHPSLLKTVIETSSISAKVSTSTNRSQSRHDPQLYTTLRKLSLTPSETAAIVPGSNDLQETDSSISDQDLAISDLVIEYPTGTPPAPSLPRGKVHPNHAQQNRKLSCPVSDCKWSFNLRNDLLKHLKFPHQNHPEAKQYIEALEAKSKEREVKTGIKQKEVERLQDIQQKQQSLNPVKRERLGRFACRMGLFCPKLSFKNERARSIHERRCTYRFAPN